jgi:low temperature requirement protein LtrA
VPDNQSAIDTFKRATWLELFYDVAFVALVAQLTYLTATNYGTLTDFLNIFIVGYAIFIAWWGTTANRNLQPTENSTDKLIIQLQMVGAFLMSVTMGATFAGEYVWFFVTFGFVRILQAMMLVLMYYRHPHTRPVTYNILEGILSGALLWVLSGFLPDPWHFVVAFAALTVDILTPLTRGRGNTIRYLNVYHLQERLGLFLMLVIGESMIVVALSNTATSLSITEPAVIFSGLALMIALWWLYFEDMDRHQGKRPKNLFVFLHSHALLFGALILLSVGYKLILEGADVSGLLFVSAGAIGLAIAIGLIRATLYQLQGRTLIISGIIFLLFCLLGVYGFVYGQVIAAVVLTSVLFGVIAFLDHKDVFARLSGQSARIEATADPF